MWAFINNFSNNLVMTVIYWQSPEAEMAKWIWVFQALGLM